MTSERAAQILHGIAGSHGVVVAPAVVLECTDTVYPRRRIAADQAAAEWERFVSAVREVRADLGRIREQMRDRPAEASILDAYMLMVEDDLLARLVHEQIGREARCADWALVTAVESLVQQFEAMDDHYLRERRHDIEFVEERLLHALSGVEGLHLKLDEPAIVVAHHLSPADTAALANQPVEGFATQVGSRTCHTAIMARALGIPAVVGLGELLREVGSGDLLILDGLRGRVTIRPTAEQLEEAKRRAARFDLLTSELRGGSSRPAVTKDGVAVGLLANIELPDEAAIASEHGAEGIGLYRTEFLFVTRSKLPSEDDQLAAFRQVLSGMGERPVTLRTFDLGGDKQSASFQLPVQLNPMMGLRAVRLALSQPEVFLAQLRAMVRASAHGRVEIMVPLVATVAEVRQARQLFDQAREQVRRAGLAMAEHIPFGVMIEVPAAALMGHAIGREVDFMSIGTNDLVQYTMAVDRGNRELAHLASPFDPAVLKLISGVVRAARSTGCALSVCGEMASEPLGALLLIGLGVRKLSMESVAIPEIKESIRRVSHQELEALAQEALTRATAEEVEQLLSEAIEPRLADLLTFEPPSQTGSRPAAS